MRHIRLFEDFLNEVGLGEPTIASLKMQMITMKFKLAFDNYDIFTVFHDREGYY